MSAVHAVNIRELLDQLLVRSRRYFYSLNLGPQKYSCRTVFRVPVRRLETIVLALVSSPFDCAVLTCSDLLKKHVETLV